jgi:thymidylate synthase (FAD)
MEKSVRLIGITQPTEEIQRETGIVSAQDLVAYVARVSNPSNQANNETAERLLKYLSKNKHWSPYEMVHLVIEINTTRDIARQILRHRSFSFQEFSQRYADPTKDLGFVTREARLQDTKNRQNSIETNDADLQELWEEMQGHVTREVKHAYEWAIQSGIAKEQARVVLPEGLTVSRMYMTGSLRSWIHYCELRCANGTQKEHREIALQCWDVICGQFPSLKTILEQ